MDEYTGLYLPNGQLTEVSLCEAAACTGLKVRLGPPPLPHAFILIQLTALLPECRRALAPPTLRMKQLSLGAMGVPPGEGNGYPLPVVWLWRVPWTQRRPAGLQSMGSQREEDPTECLCRSSLGIYSPQDKPGLQLPTGMWGKGHRTYAEPQAFPRGMASLGFTSLPSSLEGVHNPITHKNRP